MYGFGSKDFEILLFLVCLTSMLSPGRNGMFGYDASDLHLSSSLLKASFVVMQDWIVTEILG